MKLFSEPTTVGSKSHGVSFDYILPWNQYETFEEVGEEAPNGETSEEVGYASVKREQKQSSTQGGKQGVRIALGEYLENLNEDELAELREMDADARNAHLAEVEAIAEQIAKHQELALGSRVSASSKGGRSGQITVTKAKDVMGEVARTLTDEELQAEFERFRDQYGVDISKALGQ